MKHLFSGALSGVLVLVAVAGLLSGSPSAAETAPLVSKPGQYSGYSPVLYDGYQLSSQYVAARDGTKLAVDIFRPTRDGKLADQPWPVLFMHTPYNRRNYRDGLTAANYPGQALQLVKYGYVVAVADFRGLFASFGVNGAYNRGEWLDPAYWDAYDIIEWLAKQPWSNGKVGMWGCSATGGSQMQAATSMPPSLKAVFPMSCEFDVLPFGVPGGVVRDLNRNPPTPHGEIPVRDRDAAAVDADTTGAMLKAASEQHRGNREDPGVIPFRDSESPTLGVNWWQKSSPHAYLDRINKSGIAMYAAANWDEASTKYGAFFTFNNVDNPVKLIVGPQTHCNWAAIRKENGFDIVVEEHRFFDHWLKGIDNGVMREPPLYYYTYNAPPGHEWNAAPSWPLPNEKRTKFYFDAAQSLAAAAPKAPDGKDEIAIAYGIKPENRADKALTYLTPPLRADVQITGHPVVNLWVSSTATDGDFFVYLEDVAPDGKVTAYNMDGRLRASHRKLHEAPYDNLGLPWHRSEAQDITPLKAGEPAELVFDLYPISYVFKAGHQIRVTVAFAEPGTRAVAPAPVVTVYRGAQHSSSITLPVIEAARSVAQR